VNSGGEFIAGSEACPLSSQVWTPVFFWMTISNHPAHSTTPPTWPHTTHVHRPQTVHSLTHARLSYTHTRTTTPHTHTILGPDKHPTRVWDFRGDACNQSIRRIPWFLTQIHLFSCFSVNSSWSISLRSEGNNDFGCVFVGCAGRARVCVWDGWVCGCGCVVARAMAARTNSSKLQPKAQTHLSHRRFLAWTVFLRLLREWGVVCGRGAG